MSLHELRTPVKRKSLFDQGYDWAMQEYKEGAPISSLRQEADYEVNYDFGHGVNAACDFLEAQLRAEFDAET